MRALYSLMRGITRFNDRFGKWVSYLLLAIFVLLIAEITIRLVSGSPVVWTGELSQLLFGAYAALSGGYVMAHHGHVNVDLLYTRFSPRTKAVVDVLTASMFFVFMGALIYFGSSMAYESMSFWERSQSAWNPPIWPVKLAIPVGAVLLFIQGTVKFVQDVLIALNVPPPEGVTSWHYVPEEHA